MSEPTFQIIFRGKILSGFDRTAVRDNLAKLFRTDATRIDHMLDTPKTVIKTGLGREAAARYQEVLRGAGIMVAVMGETADVVAPSPPVSVTSAPTPAAAPGPVATTDTLTLAPVGAQIIEPPARVERQIDTSALSLAAPGATIGDLAKPEPRHFDLSGISLATDTGPIDKTPKAGPAKIDTSALSLENRAPDPEPVLSDLQKQMLME